jgi:hypothetical protein
MLFRLSFVILSAVNLSVIILSVIILNVIILNVVILSVVILCVVILSVVNLSVINLSVVILYLGMPLREMPHRSHALKRLGKMGEQFTIAKSFVVAAPNLAKVAETIKKISERESQFSKSGTLHRWTDGEEM